MRAPDVQTSFAGGMISESAWGRIDSSVHQHAASLIENAIVDSEGGVDRAPGTIVCDAINVRVSEKSDAVLSKSTKMALWDEGEHKYLIVFAVVHHGSTFEHTVLIYSFLDGNYDQIRLTPYLDGGSQVVFTQYEIGVTGEFTDLHWDDAADISTVFFWDAYAGEWRMAVCGSGLEPVFIARDSGGTHPWRIFSDSDMWDSLGIENQADDDNFPQKCFFFEGRLGFAKSNNRPTMIRLSATANPSIFNVPPPENITAASALDYDLRLDGGEMNWIVAANVILIGASTGETVLRSHNGAPLAYDNAVQRSYTKFGSSSRPAGISVNDSILFVQGTGDRIREYQYSNERQSYVSPDIATFAREVFGSSVVAWDVQYRPFVILWMVTEKGDLIGCTFDKANRVVAFHRHTTNGKYRSVIVVPNIWEPGGPDVVTFLVERDLIPHNDPNFEGAEDKARFYLEHFHVPESGVKPRYRIYSHCSWVYHIPRPSEIGEILTWDNSGSNTQFKCSLDFGSTAWLHIFDHDRSAVVDSNLWCVRQGYDPEDSLAIYLIAGAKWEDRSPVPGDSLGFVIEGYNPDNELGGTQIREWDGGTYREKPIARGVLDGASMPMYIDQDRQDIYLDTIYVDGGGFQKVTGQGIDTNGTSSWAGWDQEAVVATLPIAPFDASGPNVDRTVDASIRFRDTPHARVGSRDEVFSYDFRPSGWLSYNRTPVFSGERYFSIPDSFDGDGRVFVRSVDGKPLGITRIIATAVGSRR